MLMFSRVRSLILSATKSKNSSMSSFGESSTGTRIVSMPFLRRFGASTVALITQRIWHDVFVPADGFDQDAQWPLSKQSEHRQTEKALAGNQMVRNAFSTEEHKFRAHQNHPIAGRSLCDRSGCVQRWPNELHKTIRFRPAESAESDSVLYGWQYLDEKKKTKTARSSGDELDGEDRGKASSVSLNEILNSQLSTAQSLMKISWSNNSIASISTAGQLFFGFVANEVVQWSSYWLLVLDCKKMLLKNILIDYEQELEFNDPIIRYSLQFGNLVVLSINQCFVYPLPRVDPLNRRPLNSPINPTIIQLKDSDFHMILQSANQVKILH
ncbi:hypothetical protein L1887_62315 [Cichorium endivia]|nr:hypothetical protein L1887_62315 [Cichorium endivia]